MIYCRDKNNHVISVNVNKVYQDGKIPFQQDSQVMCLDANTLKYILEDNNVLIALKAQFKANSITEKSLKRVVEKTEIETSDELEENEVNYIAIIGKGKKAKRVEINSVNNLFDEIPKSNNITGVQLAFSF